MRFNIDFEDQGLMNTSNFTMETEILFSQNCIHLEQEHSTYFSSQNFTPLPFPSSLDHTQTGVVLGQEKQQELRTYGPNIGEISSGLADKVPESIERVEDMNKSPIFYESVDDPSLNLVPQSFSKQPGVVKNMYIDNEKSGNITKSNRKSVHKAQQRYSELMSKIDEISAKNIDQLLVDVLRDCSHNIPLDDFYNILYNENTPRNLAHLPENKLEDKLDKKTCSDSKLEELKLCHLVLKTFKQKDGDFGINFEPVRKTFLGIKILFDSLKPAHETPSSDTCILRASVYNAYYIICKRLTQKYSNNSKTSLDERKLLLTQSQLGKVMKIVFPTVEACRKGKRGDSKFNYRGLSWNTSVVDEGIMSLAQSSLPDLEILFKNPHKALPNSKESKKRKRDDVAETSALTSDPKKTISELTLMCKKPLHSFVSSSSTYPAFNCFLRTLNIVPGQPPRQAKWALEAIKNSIAVLKKEDIILEYLSCNLNQAGFCTESMDGFFEEIISKLHSLSDEERADDVCLHLYLVALMLVFPVVLSSNKEVSTRDKTHLRVSLANFVTRVESVPMVSIRSQNRMTFTGILKRLIDFMALSMLLHSTSAATGIIKAMIGDSRLRSERQFESTNDEPRIKEICTKSAFMACSAFNWKLLDKKFISSTDLVEIIERLSKVYIEFVSNGIESMSKIPDLINEEELQSGMFDLSYQIFTTMTADFHVMVLGDSVVGKLPMMLINNFVFSVISEIQNISFRHFTRRKTDLSTQLFRAWWIHVNMVQAYLNAISEVCALSQHLS